MTGGHEPLKMRTFIFVAPNLLPKWYQNRGKPGATSSYLTLTIKVRMHFHLAHIVPGKITHGLNGYKEVIDTVQWGLRELGHTAVYGLNTLSPNATNIIFGVQMMAQEILEQLPSETIVYNFEQGRGWSSENLKPQIKIAAERFQIWDYSEGNATVWAMLGAERVCTVPVGYAPILQRITKADVQDIDVLMYGSPGQDRLGAFHYLSQSGLTTAFVCGLYGQARDDLIGRSKLIVNVNRYDKSKIFEVVRVSYLLANHKAIVADVDADTLIDEDIRRAVKCSEGPQLVKNCQTLIDNDDARASLENAGFEIIQKRDIRVILECALAFFHGRTGP